MNEDRVTLPVNEEMWPMGETLRDEKYRNMMSWARSRAISEILIIIRTGMICTEIATQLFLAAMIIPHLAQSAKIYKHH